MSVLYIITGSNGAGKSSVGPDYIPNHLRDSIFDGDKLFMQKRSEFWVNGIKSHKECKKLVSSQSIIVGYNLFSFILAS